MKSDIKGDIARLRKEAGLSQQQLADKMRVNRAAIIKWEKGTTYPRARNIRKLGNILGVTIPIKGIIEPQANMKIEKDNTEPTTPDYQWYKKTIETLIHQNGNHVDKLHERDQAEIEDLKKEKSLLWDDKAKAWEHIDALTANLQSAKNR